MNLIMSSIVYCVVGCNTGASDHQSLHVLRCDTATGAAEIVQTVTGCDGTTYFQPDAARRWLYSVVGEKTAVGSRSAAVRFPLRQDAAQGWRIGACERLATLPCEAPCHVALSPDGALFSFAAYCSATAGAFPVAAAAADAAAGRVTAVPTAVLPDVGMGPRTDRQQKAFAHCTFYTPDGKLMGVVDLGTDKIVFFPVDSNPGSFALHASLFALPAEPGDGPRHALFSKDGRFLFVVNELSSTVASYAYDGKRGFRKLGRWPMTPEGTDPATTKAAAIKLTADGKLLMASNRGLDSIAFFAVGDDGLLTPKGRAPLKGRFPRDFELMPGEKFMVVGHKMSNAIQVYAFDRAACTLAPVGKPIPCWRPLCFKFL